MGLYNIHYKMKFFKHSTLKLLSGYNQTDIISISADFLRHPRYSIYN